LNYIKSLKPNAVGPDDLADFNNMHNPSKFDWLVYSINGCGRFGDINMSSTQHMANWNQQIIMPNLGATLTYQGRNSDWWNELNGDVAQKNYLEGLMLIADSGAGRFLLHQPDNFYSMKQFPTAHEMSFQ